MPIYISFSPLGVSAYDEKGKHLESVWFKKGAEASSMKACMSEKLSDDEKKLLSKLKSKDIIFEVKKQGCAHEFPNMAGIKLRENLDKLAKKQGVPLNKIMYEANLELTKEDIKASVGDDNLIMQAVSAIDDIDKTANLLYNRLKEWYGLYYPELPPRVSSYEKFVKMVAEKTSRDKINPDEAKMSMGADLSKKDIEEMKILAESINTLYKEKERLEKYVSEKTKELMPNTTAIINPMLAARMLSDAGSLQKLARFPSSTIQVLGAERALFRHLHGRGSSPKHGLIFQEPSVNQAKKPVRGKVARHLASKLSIALKVDAYQGEFVGDKLKKEYDSFLKKLK